MAEPTTAEQALAAAIDAVRDGDDESTEDVAKHFLAALRAAGWAVPKRRTKR